MILVRIDIQCEIELVAFDEGSVRVERVDSRARYQGPRRVDGTFQGRER